MLNPFPRIIKNVREDSFSLFIYGLMILFVIASGMISLANYVQNDYHGIYYFKTSLLYLIPFAVILLGASIFYKKSMPMIAFCTWTYTIFFFMYLCFGYLCTSVQYTTSPLIDHWIIYFDQSLGYNSVAALKLGSSNHWFHRILTETYNDLGDELLLLPFIRSFLPGRVRAIKVFFFATLLSGLIGMLIYYFFPTAAPAHFFKSPLFSNAEHNTFLKFYEIHHKLTITSVDGGIIAFPSFHVLWALLVTYLFKDIKILFYPVVIFNAVLILSTLLLGWHYLSDALSSLTLGTISIYIAEKLYRKYQQKGRA